MNEEYHLRKPLLRKTKDELITLLLNCQRQLSEKQDTVAELSRQVLHAHDLVADKARLLNEQKEQHEDTVSEYEHALQSVLDGVRQTLNHDSKLYDRHHNTYYALWYWVMWGRKVAKSLRKRQED